MLVDALLWTESGAVAMEVVMKIGKTLFAIALGSILVIGTSGYAVAQERWERGEERWERGAERQEQIARSEMRRGEALEQAGHRLEREGQWWRGEMLVRRGEALENHGQQMLREAERREHFGERWDNRERWEDRR
jgi:hypothetical protein